MLIPLLTEIREMDRPEGMTMEAIYKYVGISRQSYFQSKHRLEKQERMVNEIRRLVEAYRFGKDRRAGSRSLYYNLNIKDRYDIGVSTFERLMSSQRLTLAPLRVRIVTTKSDLQSWNYEDLTPGLIVDGINQLIVGDLTYVGIGKDMYYLFCLTDLYSARIVGHHLGSRMRAKEARCALDRWIRLRGKSALHKCIHHSDGGAQYFSKEYLSKVQACEVRISVSKNCLDNGYAEQRNGFIKHHLIPTIHLQEGRNLQTKMDEMINYYNCERKQEALGWESPVSYEEKWQNNHLRPLLKMYDRANGQRSKRGFLGGICGENNMDKTESS